MDFFLKGTDDVVKKVTLEHNKAHWLAIQEELKEWVQANWWRWKEEKPEWFSLAWQKQVPEGWIEDATERSREKGRRRSSVDKIKGVFGKGRV